MKAVKREGLFAQDQQMADRAVALIAKSLKAIFVNAGEKVDSNVVIRERDLVNDQEASRSLVNVPAFRNVEMIFGTSAVMMTASRLSNQG